MPSKYVIGDHQAPHFITFSTVQWIDALSRPEIKHLILDSFRYCQAEKGLILYAYVIMSNHVHIIAAAAESFILSDILRDLKKFTSKAIFHEIKENPMESRKKWMIWLFESNGKRNINNKYFQVWQQKNHPIELSNNYLMDQKLEYLHNNPVKAGLVYEPQHYVFSSAIDYAGGRGLIPIDFLE
jgi:putative transposase